MGPQAWVCCRDGQGGSTGPHKLDRVSRKASDVFSDTRITLHLLPYERQQLLTIAIETTLHLSVDKRQNRKYNLFDTEVLEVMECSTQKK